jgi:hypothetical protein
MKAITRIMGVVTPEYHSWSSMIQRCTNPKRDAWPLYGGRGITVCDRWRIFAAFLEDMGPRPGDTTLDRIDPDGNYEPGNCRWATSILQGRNKRNSVAVCQDCNEDRPPYRRGKCHRCNEYSRRNGGAARPSVADLRSLKVGLGICPNCSRFTKLSVKRGTCTWCYRAAWARANRRTS